MAAIFPEFARGVGDGALERDGKHVDASQGALGWDVRVFL